MLGYLRGRGFPDPEDVCGETFLDVVRGLHRFEGDERGFRSWVLAIAHHRGLDAVRARDRRPAEPTSTERLHDVVPPSPGADLPVLVGAATDETVALLGGLGDDQREVLLLRVLGGLTAAEIAEVTGRTRDAVKALQKRGIARLRERFDTQEAASDHRATSQLGAPRRGARDPGHGPETLTR